MLCIQNCLTSLGLFVRETIQEVANSFSLWFNFYLLKLHTKSHENTANPTWGDIFESSKLKARKSLLQCFSEKRLSSFELQGFEL